MTFSCGVALVSGSEVCSAISAGARGTAGTDVAVGSGVGGTGVAVGDGRGVSVGRGVFAEVRMTAAGAGVAVGSGAGVGDGRDLSVGVN